MNRKIGEKREERERRESTRLEKMGSSNTWVYFIKYYFVLYSIVS